MATRPVVEWREASTERSVLAAALKLFSQRGFHAVGIREIAREAGISTAALYHYMETKDQLLLALMLDRLSRIIEATQIACEGVGRPEEQLVSIVRVHVIAHARFPSHIVDDEVRSLQGAARREVVKVRDEYEGMWAKILEEGARSGVFDIDDLRFTRLGLLEMCNGVNRWFSSQGPASAERVADAFADLALKLVSASRGGRPLRRHDLPLPPAEEAGRIVARAYEGVDER